jgi:subtilisin
VKVVAGKYIVRMPRHVERARRSGFWQSSSKPTDPIADVLNAVEWPEGVNISVIRGALDSEIALIDVSEEQRAAIERANPGVGLFPLKTYSLIASMDSVVLASITPSPAPSPLPPAGTFDIKVVDDTGNAIPNATVRLCDPSGTMSEAVTSGMGQVAITLPVGFADCFVSTSSGFWTAAQPALYAADGQVTVKLQRLDAAFDDCKKHHYPSVKAGGGRGVKVAVIDTGVDDHKDLPCVAQRTTLVASPPQNLIYDNGIGHGTHVAGIIGANGATQGLAPNVELSSYRVFEEGNGTTDNYRVMQAILKAIADGADIINLSIGDVYGDAGLESAIDDAAAVGVLVVAASGNFGQGAVCHPAALANVVSVGAVGRVGTFPPGTIHAALSRRAQGTDPDDFVPAFSNFGKVDLAAPGVGIVSTIGKDGYVALDGTSMAAPVVTGVAACLLSDEPSLQGRARAPERLAELRKLLYAKCRSLGFDPSDVGSGLPQ